MLRYCDQPFFKKNCSMRKILYLFSTFVVILLKYKAMRQLRLLFTALLIICGTTAFAETVVIDGITYDIVEKAKTAIVVAGDTEYSGDIVIPETIVYNDVTYSITSIGDWAFNGCDGLTSIAIPNSVTTIGDYAFNYCDGLESVTIPNSVTSIGNYAFRDCRGLKSITLGNNVKTIGDYAFHLCDELTSVTIPNSVTSIGNYAFRRCFGLKSLTLGNGITTVGYEAFSACTSLTTVKTPHSLTVISYEMFSNCTSLTSVTIGDNVEYIHNGAFYGCSSLTKITIPNSVVRIDKKAFSDCSALKSVTIGSNVHYIYEEAFSKCPNITDIYCFATATPSTDIDAFKESYPEHITLHVPKDAINSYRTSQPWSNFGTIVTLDGGNVKKCATPSIAYSNGNLYFNCDTEEAEFVTDITSNDFGKFYNNCIELSATYNISLYATAQGYENSETVNAALCWIDNNNGNNSNNIINVQATPILIISTNGIITINCTLNGEAVAVYTTGGVFVGTTTIENGSATIATGLSKGAIAIVKIGEKNVKVII